MAIHVARDRRNDERRRGSSTPLAHDRVLDT
jgi:hypothetical protein